jgi:hypothetical protein
MSISRIYFKDFILNEKKHYLSQKIGILLSDLQDLQQNYEGMGKRQLIFNSESIVSKMRAILQDVWDEKEEKHLKTIQKIALSISKCIEEKGELIQTLNNSIKYLEKISSELGTPVNDIGSNEDQDSENNSKEKNQDNLNNQQNISQ